MKKMATFHVYDYCNDKGWIVSWNFSLPSNPAEEPPPPVDYTQIYKCLKSYPIDFKQEKELYPCVEAVLFYYCEKLNLVLWIDEEGRRLKGMKYPDFAIYIGQRIGKTPDFDRFRILIEVESQILHKATSASLISTAKIGIGQFIQWLYFCKQDGEKYGVVNFFSILFPNLIYDLGD